MTYEYSLKAEKEVDKIIDYYDRRREGLGGEFHADIVNTIGQIIDHPDMWPKASRRTRRCLTDRFPYGVIYYYDERQQHILIVAIAHNKQRPGYWKDRF